MNVAPIRTRVAICVICVSLLGLFYGSASNNTTVYQQTATAIMGIGLGAFLQALERK